MRLPSKVPKRKTKMQILAGNLFHARTKAQARDILSDMVDASAMHKGFPDEYIEEVYLGLRETNGGTTVADIKKLAKRYMR